MFSAIIFAKKHPAGVFYISSSTKKVGPFTRDAKIGAAEQAAEVRPSSHFPVVSFLMESSDLVTESHVFNDDP